jgi:hypothetical protein
MPPQTSVQLHGPILINSVMGATRLANAAADAALEGGEKELNTGNRYRPEGSGSDRPSREISHLQRREIQAPIAACLIRGFARVMGLDKALEAATAAVQEDALMAGKAMAERHGGNSMKVLARIVREVWAQDDAMTIRILEETEENLSFDVTCCRYAELYEKTEMKELGFCLSCSRDEPFTKGFNPRMRLLRTQTIMQGASFCDFRFVFE